MPLKKIPYNATEAQKKKIISENIKAEIKAGKSPKQAQAIALSKARSDSKKRRSKKR